jgi:hypothetical protein
MPRELTDDEITKLSEAIFNRRKIEAIKIYREATGLGLKESKDAVEELEASLRQKSPERFTAAKGGCQANAAVFLLVCLSAICSTYWLAQA